MRERNFNEGDIVKHFKRENIDDNSQKYLYKIIAFAKHSETNKLLVIYEQLYPPFETYARPYEMFVSKVDKEKYPDVVQEYRFEKIEEYDLKQRL